MSGCEQNRATGHALLDGDLTDAVPRAAFDGHLAACAECREWFADLSRLQQGLRELPQPPFPDRALEELWAATSGGAAQARRFRIDWRPLAAAAALTLALFGLLRDVAAPPSAPAHSQQEIAEAAEQARLVFELTAQALNKAERTAVREIADEVSPALRRVPLRWSASEENDETKRQGV